jgi:hypothetical protein
MKPEILAFVILEDNLSRFSSRRITSSSIIISLIINLLIVLFNIFLITFIIKRKY